MAECLWCRGVTARADRRSKCQHLGLGPVRRQESGTGEGGTGAGSTSLGGGATGHAPGEGRGDEASTANEESQIPGEGEAATQVGICSRAMRVLLLISFAVIACGGPKRDPRIPKLEKGLAHTRPALPKHN